MKTTLRMKFSAVIYVSLLSLLPMGAKAESHWADSLSVEAEAAVSAASNASLNPLYLYSQRWGVYTQYERREALVHARADLRLANFRHFSAHAGLGIVGKSEVRRSMIHEAYVSGRVFIFDYTLGMQASTPVARYDRYTSGNYLMSTNARPLPRFGVGIFDYWSIPLTRSWLQIRGGIYVGRLFNDDYDDRYTASFTHDVLTHEKFAYARVGGWHVKPYVGIIHSALMGGTLPSGEEIPVDFWSTFMAKGSDKFTGYMRGEATNAAGAHQGLWDWGFDVDFDALEANVYCKRPFADGSGTNFFSSRNKDFFAGAVVSFRRTSHLRRLSVEYMTTDYQCGDGNPDPVGYDKNGTYLLLYPGDLPQTSDGLKEWFYAHFEASDIDEWTARNGMAPYRSEGTAYAFFREKWNHGFTYSGRDSYLSNGLYMQGWSSFGLSTGNALYHTQQTVDTYSDGYAWQHLVTFPNVRVKALTLAADVDVNDRCSVFAKVSVTRNHGNMIEKYQGGINSWTLAENYYFTRHKNEVYTCLEASYVLVGGLSLNGTLCADWGDLYSSLGGRLSMTYRLHTCR